MLSTLREISFFRLCLFLVVLFMNVFSFKEAMSTHTYKRNEDLDSVSLPDKMSVYQECLSSFNASPILAMKCRSLLARLLRLIFCGETFQSVEATNLFFSISKLFHNDDVALRQLAYLAIKELSQMADDTLMITASIMKDIQGGQQVYKPNAVRTLSRVLDSGTIHAAERLFKNSIVDSNQSVASAALVSSYHLLPVSKDVVKRWANETQEAVGANKSITQSQYTQHEGGFRAPSTTYIHQYHALGLLYQFRNHDKMSLIKMIQQLVERKTLSSSLANVELIRFVEKLIDEDSSMVKPLWSLFQSWLNNKSDMVSLEAAKLILNNSSKFSNDEQMHAISTLQNLLSVPRTVTRFAAVRILNKVAMKEPEIVRVCNGELERLISDSSRSISTYAITTLLKTGNSENVDRLVETITGFMSEISDEFKVIVIDAIRTLSLKFPQKYKPMLKFLDETLRDEGGYIFKNSIVEAMFDIIKFIPEAKEDALELLCDFIEDCEYTELSVRILHLLGNEGPKTKSPTEYVRYIYNRVVLENSLVRSSAVIALSKFALLGDSNLSKSIKILLERCLQDIDDEVRDRAALCLRLLESSNPEEAKKFIQPSMKYSLGALEQQLSLYVSNPNKESFKSPFDINSIPTMTEEEFLAQEYKEKLTGTDEIQVESPVIIESVNEKIETGSDITKYTLKLQDYQTELSLLPEIGEYGQLLHSSKEVELTEKETEFVVSAVKHIFPNHLVVQYNIENTLEGVILENVSIGTQSETELLTEEFTLPIERLEPMGKASIYVSFNRSEEINYEPIDFVNTLIYESKDVDADAEEEGFPDEYQIDDLSILPYDFISPSFTGNFTNVWDSLAFESSAIYNLGNDGNVQEVVNKYVNLLTMLPLEGSELVNGDGKGHILKLYGKSINGGDQICCQIAFAVSSKGVMMKWTVKGDDEQLVESVANDVQ